MTETIVSTASSNLLPPYPQPHPFRGEGEEAIFAVGPAGPRPGHACVQVSIQPDGIIPAGSVGFRTRADQ